ncbi:MAG TPA: 2-amino-4-hydroxy-6-hydroxymethyldihydropteridine diphosphokinase [Burkholderiaceae bacterium]|nr:2-amino-4-hydroxy-6-hydroxymethyldihydropteridine diphosphokinase [Burkholderiaceae bacterium]
MPIAYVGLGANLGDARGTLRRAIDRLAALPATRLVGVSRVWRSAPLEASGPDFFNAAAALDTSLDAFALLAALQNIEHEFGRQRPYRNAPRTLDLDLLMHGDEVITTEALTIPHPRMHLRRFVIGPLADLDMALVIPGLGPISQWLEATREQDAWADEMH